MSIFTAITIEQKELDSFFFFGGKLPERRWKCKVIENLFSEEDLSINRIVLNIETFDTNLAHQMREYLKFIIINYNMRVMNFYFIFSHNLHSPLILYSSPFVSKISNVAFPLIQLSLSNIILI